MLATATLPALTLAALAQTPDLPPEAAVEPETVHEFGIFLEGIHFAADGTAYVSDVPGGTVYRIPPDGAPEPWTSAAAPNGHKIYGDGSHLVIAMEDAAILRLDGEGNALGDPIVTSEGEPLDRPNDLALDGDGFYFTDPGAFEPSNVEGRVHYSGPDFQPWPVARGLSFPNGVVLAPNGGTLYVAETLTNRIIAVQLLTRGLPGRQSELVDLSGEVDPATDGFLDGITVDQDGNIYAVIHGGGQVYVVSPGGEVLRRYRAGMAAPANLAFSPTEPGRLYVVGSRDAERTEGAVTVLDLPGREGVHR